LLVFYLAGESPMFRTALITLAFALCLACPASGSAQTPRSLVMHHPRTFICDPPSGPGAQRQPIPPGKKIEDLCPPGAHAMLFLDTSPFPRVNGFLPPLFPHAAGPPAPQPDPGAKTP